jgi:hypothetical protein
MSDLTEKSWYVCSLFPYSTYFFFYHLVSLTPKDMVKEVLVNQNNSLTKKDTEINTI